MRIYKITLLFIISCFAIQFSCLAQKDKHLITSLKEHSDEVHSVAFCPDGKQFISGSKDETIKIWDFETRSIINTLQRH